MKLLNNQPLYRQIYNDLEQQISTGVIRYHEQLPILADLCSRYGVSEAPVRRALDDLERAGFVSRQRGRGKGTFAVKRLSTLSFRILVVDELDIYRSPIELVHEIFDIVAGVRDAVRESGAESLMVSRTSFGSLPVASGQTGYLMLAQSAASYKEGQRMVEAQGVPFVMVNPPFAMAAPCVRVDMELAAYAGVNFLARLGHRRIAYVGGTTGDWSAPRVSGYRRCLAEHGLDSDASLVQWTNGVEAEQDEHALEALLRLDTPPTAVFAGSDYRALHILNHARRLGLAVPRQLSICGYDDISEVAGVEPALTTVHHPRYELGREAVAALTRLIGGEQIRHLDVTIPPHVTVRASCSPPASSDLAAV